MSSGETGITDAAAGLSGRQQAWQLEAHGPQAYERYLVPAFFAPCADQLVEAAALVPGERVLDVACGTGIVARRAAAQVGTAGAVTGSDLNEGMLEVAAAAGTQPAIDWRRGDVAALPLPDGAEVDRGLWGRSASLLEGRA